MRVACWVDGEPESIDNYSLSPKEAAELYADELGDPSPIRVVVEPLDDEARALGGWHSNVDEYGPEYKLFDVAEKPAGLWNATEIDYAGNALA